MQREKNGLFQLGVAIASLGAVAYVAIILAKFVGLFAGWAILIGIILMIIGLVTPGRSRY